MPPYVFGMWFSGGLKTTHNPVGRSFLLKRLAPASYSDNTDGANQYRHACEAVGRHPIGCFNYDYTSDFNAVSGPASWTAV